MISVPWVIAGTPASATRIETSGRGLLVAEIPGDSELSVDIARHVVKLHMETVRGRFPAPRTAPATWYSDAAWSRDQVLCRPWELSVSADGRPEAVADSQFADRVIFGGTPAVVAYITAVHNASLFPVR